MHLILMSLKEMTHKECTFLTCRFTEFFTYICRLSNKENVEACNKDGGKIH